MIMPSKLMKLGIFFVGLGLVTWVACAKRPLKTLVCGDYSVKISSSGAVVSISSPGGLWTASGPDHFVAGSVTSGDTRYPLSEPIRVTPAEDGIRLIYNVKELPLEVELSYRLRPGPAAVVFSRDVAVRSESPLTQDLTVAVDMEPAILPDETWLPLKNGVGASLGAAKAALYRFAGTAPAAPLALAVPMVTFAENPSGDRCTIVTDPFYSTLFTRGTVEWTYPKSVGLENGLERRSISTVFHKGDPDAAIGQFYGVALADIPAGPDWLHDIAMVDYDYLSGGGKGWFQDIDALEAAVPPADRPKVLLALHGWYDSVGRYCFDPGSGRLDERWTAFANYPNVKKDFPQSAPVAMTLKNMHERMRYAKSRGFRVALYFADGMSAGDGLPDIFRPDRVLYWGGWVGPDTKGKTYCQNPLHPAVPAFFLAYIKALLREYGADIDAFVWDETFHVDTGSLGSEKVRGYADRALMRLVRDLTSEVHAYNRESGRSLAFLASDCIGVNKWVNKPPYALVADGTYQDTHCDPESWSYGIFPNYRNALWSCNWEPVTHFDYTEFGVRNYQAAVAVSNGYGDNIGFAKMSPEMKKKVLGLFNWRKQTRTQFHWFSKLPVFEEKGGANKRS